VNEDYKNLHKIGISECIDTYSDCGAKYNRTCTYLLKENPSTGAAYRVAILRHTATCARARLVRVHPHITSSSRGVEGGCLTDED